MKNKNHMVILIDAEESFDKIHHPFMIKPLSKVRIEETYLNVTEALTTSSQQAKTESVSLKIENNSSST